MQISLWGIARKSKQNKKYKFGNLYGLINKQALHTAWKEINRSAAAGIDKITAKEFGEDLDRNLDELLKELKNKSYKARLTKRVNIPKGNGKTRPLGLPTLRDKIVQRAVASILEAIYEQDFFNFSYGYRPNTSAQKAAKELSDNLMGNYNYIVEADIRSFFDNIDHQWLIKMLKERIKDKAFIRLIVKWLKAGILNTDGKIINPKTGSPQGSIVSPILANIYLHYSLDLWFEKVVKKSIKGEACICRVADDFVCAFRYKEDADRFYKVIGKRLGKFGLKLAEEKTKIIKFSKYDDVKSKSFDFVGFEYRWSKSKKGKNIVRRRTSRSKLKKSIQAFKDWCKRNRNSKFKWIIKMLNLKFRGYFNYYGVIGNSKGLYDFYNPAIKILFKWLNRRSQRKSFTWEEFNQAIKRYGLIRPKITEKKYKQIKLKVCFE